MRILVYNWRDLAHPLAGGAEVYTDAVATEWVAAGHEVTLFAAAVSGRPERELAPGGYAVVRRGGRHSVYREARRFWRSEGAGRFDLVVDEVNTRPFHTPAFVRGVPVVALIHQVAGEVWRYETNPLLGFLGERVVEPRWLAPYRDVPVVTVSVSSRESLQALGLRRVSVVPEGHRPCLPAVPQVREAVPTLAFVGRLSANKRPDHAIEAFRRLRARLPEAQLWLVGTGPMQERLLRNLPPRTMLWGRVSEEEKLRLLARAHAVIATSVREGWGLVVTEAAAVGTPTIAYDVPGLRDSVRASGGVLVAPNPAALAERAAALLPGWMERLPVVEAAGVQGWDAVAEAVLRRAVSQPARSALRVGQRRGASPGLVAEAQALGAPSDGLF